MKVQIGVMEVSVLNGSELQVLEIPCWLKVINLFIAVLREKQIRMNRNSSLPYQTIAMDEPFEAAMRIVGHVKK